MACRHHPKPEKETYKHVSNEALRQRFVELKKEAGLTYDIVADAVGLADGTTVARDLGLRPLYGGKVRREVEYERAVLYARVLRISYAEAGV
jgi:hypothetical protein